MDKVELQSRIEELSSTIDFQNGLIEDLRDKIAIMKTDLDIIAHAWEEDISKFAEEKESLQNQIDWLTEQIDEAERQRNSERAEVEFLNSELDGKDEIIANLEKDLRALPEVPLGELEAAIDAIIDRLNDQ